MKIENKQSDESHRLGQLRLLVALDTFLAEGSVSGAANRLGLSDAATSRLLTQIRELFEDPIFVRSGRRMIATPKAESLRGRLRKLVGDVEGLLIADKETDPTATSEKGDDGWRSAATLPVPTLAYQEFVEIAGCSTARQILDRFDKAGGDNDPISRLAKYIAIVGRRMGQTRPLDEEEAYDAFSIIFSGKADPMQISSLLSLIHYRGETASELAGMVKAARSTFGLSGDFKSPSLDWPCYLSPNSKQAPWFIQAAKLISRSGAQVILHGSFGNGEKSGKLELAARTLDIPISVSQQSAIQSLCTDGIAYLPLRAFAPQLNALMALYPLFYSRSSINSLIPLLNPLNADASFLGTSATVHKDLHRDAGQLIDNRTMSIISTNRDVAEILSHRLHLVHRLIDGEKTEFALQSKAELKVEKRANLSSFEYWKAVWTGAAIDERATRTIISTAAVGLMTARKARNDEYENYYAEAEALWRSRHK